MDCENFSFCCIACGKKGIVELPIGGSELTAVYACVNCYALILRHPKILRSYVKCWEAACSYKSYINFIGTIY